MHLLAKKQNYENFKLQYRLKNCFHKLTLHVDDRCIE